MMEEIIIGKEILKEFKEQSEILEEKEKKRRQQQFRIMERIRR